ncbi:phospholipase D-like domain-containing protein [Streptomyces nojiriensis]|uniref:phospholipase D-like domain-containing protein n=1 Tax=Streptomyces nojiriensis TaxID=66374 RepID=UPI0036DBA91A
MYEFEYLPMLEAFRVAAETGVDVRLVVFDHPDNRKAVAAAGIEDLVVTWRTRATIPHDKFVIASHEGVPRSVWTGSTNITENGIFGQSNVGHTVTDASVARQYRDYWAQLVADPTPGTLNNRVDAENPMPDPWPAGISVVFSPHTHTTAQDRYADLFGSAQDLLCITFPFTFDPRFSDQLPGDHPALRWLLFENAGIADAHRSMVTDPETELVACGLVEEGGLKGWAAEHINPGRPPPRGDLFHRVLPPVQPPPLPGRAPPGCAPADTRTRDGSRSPGAARRRALVGQVLRRTGADPPTPTAGRIAVARAPRAGRRRTAQTSGRDGSGVQGLGAVTAQRSWSRQSPSM